LVRFLIVSWKLSLGKWIYLNRTLNRFAFLIRLLIAALFLWAPLALVIIEIPEYFFYRVQQTYSIVYAYLIFWGILSVWILICAEVPTVPNWFNFPCKLLAYSPIFRSFMQIIGINGNQMDCVYVSDGGHYENLGVYALLQLKRKKILSFDAGFDPDITMEGLQTVLTLAKERKLIKSFEVKTKDKEFSKTVPEDLKGEKKLVESNLMEITVKYDDKNEGEIYYTIMSLTKDDPEAIRLYSRSDVVYPNHPTANQFFTPVLFQAYHDLGIACAERLLKRLSVIDQAPAEKEQLTKEPIS